MRVFGKVAWGLGAAAAIYLCVDMFTMGSRSRVPKNKPKVAEEQVLVRAQQAPLMERVRVPPSVRPPAVAVSAPVPDPAAEHPQPNRAAELATVLESEYAVDARPTRESSEKEKVLQGLFSNPALAGKGRLEQVECREKICRGVVRIANEQADNEVFGRSLASPEFMSAIHDAVTVASRQKMSDGSVVATFFVHPQSVFGMLAL